MADDHGCGVMVQGPFDDLPGMDGRAVDRAPKQGLIPNQAMPSVQIQAAEDLVRQVGELRLEELRRISWGP